VNNLLIQKTYQFINVVNGVSHWHPMSASWVVYGISPDCRDELQISLILSNLLFVASCTNTWTLSANTNYAGGTGLISVTTLSDCQAACIATANCIAIDYNPSTSPQCYWLSSLSGTKFSGQNSGINHYDLSRCVTTTTTSKSFLFH